MSIMIKFISLVVGLFVSTSSMALDPFKDVDVVLEYVRSFAGEAEELKLPISEELIDPFGMNMAIITDAILAKGFEPNGFERQRGYRVYVYKSL